MPSKPDKKKSSSRHASLNAERTPLLILAWRTLAKALMFLPKAGKETFIALIREELSAEAVEQRLLPNIQHMARLLFTDPKFVQEQAMGGNFILNIHESVWHLVFLLDLLYAACEGTQWLSKGRVRRESFQLKVLVENANDHANLQNARTPRSAQNVHGVIAPEADFHLFVANCGAKLFHPTLLKSSQTETSSTTSIDESPVLIEYDPRGAYCGLPKEVYSFIAHPYLCPTEFKQRVLTAESSFTQSRSMQQNLHSGIVRQIQTARAQQMAAAANNTSDNNNPIASFMSAMMGGFQGFNQNAEVPQLDPGFSIGPDGNLLIADSSLQDLISLRMEVSRDNIVPDTFTALEKFSTASDLTKPLKIVFKGEEGMDDGGLSREFFRLLAQQLFSPAFGMFVNCEESRAIWFNPAAISMGLATVADFRKIGLLLGLAVYNGIRGIETKLPSLFFRKLVGEPVGESLAMLSDLEQIQPFYARSLNAVLDWKPSDPDDEKARNEEFEDIFCLTFCLTLKDSFEEDVKCELIPDGENVPVTFDRREEFVLKTLKFLTTLQCRESFDALREGYKQVCRSPVSESLGAQELELLICGERLLDFEALRQGTRYEGGFKEGDEYIQTFWEILKTYPLDMKKSFLDFVTGSDIPPVGGLKNLGLVVQKNGEEPTKRLPTASTCYNILLLPEYSGKAKLEYKLRIALGYSEGFGLK